MEMIKFNLWFYIVVYFFFVPISGVQADHYNINGEKEMMPGTAVLYSGDVFYVTDEGREIYRIYQDNDATYQVAAVLLDVRPWWSSWGRQNFLHVTSDYLIFNDIYSYLPDTDTLYEWDMLLDLTVQTPFTTEPLIYLSTYRYSEPVISVNYKSSELQAFIETAYYPMEDAVDYLTLDNEIIVCDEKEGLVHLRLDAFDTISLVESVPDNLCKRIVQQDDFILTVDGKSLKKYQLMPDKTLNEVSRFTGA